MFYEAVKTDSFWDHKWQLSALFPSMGLSRRYHHVYIDKEIPYDAWSNIHFGVVGKYCRFSENTLLGGADVAQMIDNIKDILKLMCPEGDTICDKNAIRLGFLIYNKYVISNTIYADEILLNIMNDEIFLQYFQNGECPDE